MPAPFPRQEPSPQPSTDGSTTIPGFVPPTTATGQGPTFGGATASGAPLVGYGRSMSYQQRDWTRGGALARDIMGAQPGTPFTQTNEVFQQAPADEVQRNLFDIPKPELVALQKRMYDAGFYGNVRQDAVVYGAVDDATWDAFGNLLEMTVSYNAAGRQVIWQDILSEVQALRKEQGTNLLDNQGPERAPFVARTTAPEDIERLTQEIARSLTGQAADPATVAQIVARYRGEEVSSQRAAYDAAETGGTVADAPNRQTFVEEAIETADPNAVTAYRGADSVMAAFESILAGPFGG